MADRFDDHAPQGRRAPLSMPAAMVFSTLFIWAGLAAPTTTLFIMRSGSTTAQDVGILTVLAAAAATSTLGVWFAGTRDR